MDRNFFIRKYAQNILNKSAAVFIGAGVSIASGYPDWENLVEPLAEELGLDMEKENDLLKVMQYYENTFGRNEISMRILNEFQKTERNNTNLEIITRLPIDTYWTTNYDREIEKYLEKNNRKIDVKITEKNLATNVYNRSAVLYKMHGDVTFPEDAVITKDDYDKYNSKKSLFKNALIGDLIGKTFLFIGFSFKDPNIDHVLSQIKLLIGNHKRKHYCIMKKVDSEANSYDAKRQEFFEKDLERYGIYTIYIDKYDEITNILSDIEKKVLFNNIFISGSNAEEADELKLNKSWHDEKVRNFSYKLSNSLIKKNYKIISGFGLGIGSYVLNGSLDAIYTEKQGDIDNNLILRPFPQLQDCEDIKSKWTNYRNEIIKDAGVCIFIFGNKLDKQNKNILIADGVKEEFKIAKEKEKIIIPIGSTGWAAEEIWKEVHDNIKEYSYLENYIDLLKKETNIDNLVTIIINILEEIKNK